MTAALLWPASLHAAAPDGWLTGGELLQAKPDAWAPLDSELRASLLPDRRSGRERALVIDFLEGSRASWLVHRGDLVVEGSLSNGHALIVLGDLTIQGSYDDSSDDHGYGMLLVTGSLTVADHLLSWGSLHVSGDLRAAGLVFAYYNDFTFEVGGRTRARILVIDDKAAEVRQPMEGMLLDNTRSPVDAGSLETSTLSLHPEVLAVDMADGIAGGWWPDFDAVQDRLLAGQPLFRAEPAPRSLIDRLELLLAEATPSSQVDRLAFEDPLLQLAAAYFRDDLSKATVERMIDQGGAQVLQALAGNESVRRSQRRAASKRLERLR